MQDLMEMAVEAIRCRREKNPIFGEIIREMECAGLSPKRITQLLSQAEQIVPIETPASTAA